MATITIKIESEELAREVLTQLGYLPSDDVPDLISDVSEDEPEDFGPKTESSRDAFAEQQIPYFYKSNSDWRRICKVAVLER